MATKKCKTCAQVKPIEEFATMGKRKSHLRRGSCKKCLYKKYKKYYCKYQKDNREKVYRFKWHDSTEAQKIEHLKKIFDKAVIRKQDGCWGWKNKLHKTGYGVLQYNGRQTGAHRVSWIIHNGKIPEGLVVCHKCDNKKCTRADHLFLGTYKDNSRDMAKKGRGGKLKGDRCPWSKLDVAKVKKIKQLLKLGVTAIRIAKDFNVHPGTIYDIKHGKNWKHVK